jgi:hypothetical protein
LTGYPHTEGACSPDPTVHLQEETMSMSKHVEDGRWLFAERKLYVDSIAERAPS